MMNNSFLKPVLIAFIIIGFSQCGVITKTRYGNGLKMDLEWGKKATSYDSTYIKKVAARKALRKRQFAEKSPLPLQTPMHLMRQCQKKSLKKFLF